jgi:hypothetical protein
MDGMRALFGLCFCVITPSAVPVAARTLLCYAQRGGKLMFFLPQRGFLTRLSVIAAAALYCTACGARLDGGIYAGGTGEFTLKTTLLPNMSRLLKSLSQDGGDAAVLNADALGKTFSAMPGIESASLVNTAPGSLEGRIKVSDIAAFLNRSPPASQNAASWE